MKKINKQIKSAVLSITLSSMIYSNAMAGGYSTYLHSTSGLGNSYAGSSTGSHDVSDIYFNPSTTAGIDKNEAIFSLNYLQLKIDPDNMVGANALGNVNGRDLSNAGSQTLIPAFYLSSPVSDKLSLNFALTSPFGLRTSYSADWAGKYRGLNSSIKTLNFNPSIAYKINNDLSVGAGVVAQYFSVNLSGMGVDSSYNSSVGRMAGNDWGYGFNLGANYNITQKTKLGIGYRSKIDHNIKGDTHFSTMSSKFKSNTSTPESFSVGVSHNLTNDLQLVADSIWTRWSRLRNLKVNSYNPILSTSTNYNWNDSFLNSLGANYKLNSNNLIRFGMAYEIEAINRRNRAPRVPASNKYWLSAGINHKLSNNFELDFAYVHQFYQASKIQINDMGANNVEGTLNGRYKTSVNVFSLALKKQF